MSTTPGSALSNEMVPQVGGSGFNPPPRVGGAKAVRHPGSPTNGLSQPVHDRSYQTSPNLWLR